MIVKIADFTSVLEVSIALNSGYSLIVSLRQSRFVFFDLIDELGNKGLISANVQSFAGALHGYMRSIIRSINQYSLIIMILNALASGAILIYAGFYPDWTASSSVALGVLAVLLLPSLISMFLTFVITHNCRRGLIALIVHAHSQTYLDGLLELERQDSVSKEAINMNRVNAWNDRELRLKLDNANERRRKEMGISLSGILLGRW